MTALAPMDFWTRFAFVVLLLSVTRGLVPLLTGSAGLAEPTYAFSTLLGIVLALRGLYVALYTTTPIIPKTLRLLLLINLALHLWWLLPIILLRPDVSTITSGVIYTGLLPFSIFLLIKLPEKYLAKALVLFTVVVSGSVMLDFIELNTMLVPGGLNLAMERHLLLRPNFEAFGYTDSVYRAVGIFGHRPHDAAIFLAMLSVYWFQTLVQTRGPRILIAVWLFLSIVGLLMTQVASNILAFFVGILFLAVANPKPFLKVASVTFLPAILIIAVSLSYLLAATELPLDLLWKWQQRASGEGDWSAMFIFDAHNPFADLFSFFAGHGLSLDLSGLANSSEFSFVKMLMEYGVFHWVILMCVLAYPIWRYVAMQQIGKRIALPYIGALVVGLISLWHYESVLHITSIFLVFAFYAQALRIFAECTA